MKLEYDPNERSPIRWFATTDDGNYDGAGITPIDAVCALATALETAIRNETAGT